MSKYFVPAEVKNLVKGCLSPHKAPSVIIESGDTVVLETVSKLGTFIPFGEYLEEHGYKLEDNPIYAKILASEAMENTMPNGHTVTGPVYVLGAEPGDVLEIEIEQIDLTTDFANACVRPGAGGLHDVVQERCSYQAVFNRDRTEAEFVGTTIPLKPFFGIMGNAPATMLPSAPPYFCGGNMDCKELTAGSKLFLPVAVRGALFYAGDGHAAQGDGEVSITALETSMNGTLRFTLHKDLGYKTPVIEKEDCFIILGMGATLDQAMRQALEETVAFVGKCKGLDFNSALALTSIIGDFRVTQIVNGTVGVHGVVQKKFLK